MLISEVLRIWAQPKAKPDMNMLSDLYILSLVCQFWITLSYLNSVRISFHFGVEKASSGFLSPYASMKLTALRFAPCSASIYQCLNIEIFPTYRNYKPPSLLLNNCSFAFGDSFLRRPHKS